MAMSPKTRKVIAVVAGSVFTLAGLVIAWVGQFVVATVGDLLVAPTLTPGWSLPPSPRDFYTFLVLALCCAAGVAVTALLWMRRPGHAVRRIVYIAILVALLPVSVYNYAHADFLVNRSAQAILNVLLVFGGTVVLLELLRLKAEANDGLVLQVLAIVSLGITAVFLPALFTLVWLLNAVGVLSKSGADALGLPGLSTLAAVVSATLGWLKYRRETKPEAPSRIITDA